MKKSPVDKAQARIKRIEDSINKAQPVYHYPGQMFFYVFGITKEGKAVCLGPKMTSQDADTILAELDDGEVFELPTRDLSKATRIIKATLVERTHDIDRSLERMGHQLRR